MSFNCYLCNGTKFTKRPGEVRDIKRLDILECNDCGLVQLSDFSHIESDHYESSKMHDSEPVLIEYWPTTIEDWQKDFDVEEDARRHYDSYESIISGKDVLDFGSGSCNFLEKASKVAASVSGIEPEKRIRDAFGEKYNLYQDIEATEDQYDIITAFHVIEHIIDPIEILKKIGKKLKDKSSRIIIEVPTSSDALLTLYGSSSFQMFSYWSQHLYLFNASTLRKLIQLAGFNIICIKETQRYGIANHLYWLCRGKPGGHKVWSFLNDPVLNKAYANKLGTLGLCDTLIAEISL